MTMYRTIVIDPPWNYRLRADDPTHRARLPYESMTNAAIAALPVGDLADSDAHLYLWTTNPHLFGDPTGPSPFEMLTAWGFRYVSLLTWHKLGAPGMGHYFRGDTEHVLFGIRGRCPIPESARLSNHIAAHRGQHSRKPDRFYEIVEQVSPEPRLEMFARRRRVGWDVWGNEAPEFGSTQVPMFAEEAAS